MSNNKASKWDAMVVYVGCMAYAIEALSSNGVVEAQMNVWEALTRIDIVEVEGESGRDSRRRTEGHNFLALYYYIPNLQAFYTWRI